ncbi:MAG: hypothetical protein ACRC1U_05375 [Vibrionaceae bacterium]
MPMTRFLMEIGRENPAPPDGGAQADESEEQRKAKEEQQVQMALELGDIRQVGTTELSTKQKIRNAFGCCCCSEPVEGFPIYQFFGEEGADEIKFTLDPSLAQAACASIPPRIVHRPGEVHQGMWPALWGAFCYDHPTEETEDNYEALLRGIEVRYSGDN